jgi:hypothetical protein
MTLDEAVIRCGIAKDVQYAAGLACDIRSLKDGRMAAIISLCLTPYLSLYVYESYAKLKTIDPTKAVSLSATVEPIVARSRHSLKLFDDNKRGIAGQLTYFRDEILTPHRIWFRRKNFFARLFGADLGIFRYNTRIIATTHSLTFNSGVESSVLLSENGAIIRRIYEEYGRYFAELGARLGASGNTFILSLDPGKFGQQEEDVRSEKYYQEVFDGPANPDLNALLTFFQCLMNFAELVALGNSGADDYSAFKIRFLTLYQVLTSLRMLSNDQSQALSARSTKLLTRLVEATETQLLLSPTARPFRNTLMHYNLVSPIDTTRVDVTQPLFGLVPIYFPGHTPDSFVATVDRHIATVAAGLAEWADSMQTRLV